MKFNAKKIIKAAIAVVIGIAASFALNLSINGGTYSDTWLIQTAMGFLLIFISYSIGFQTLQFLSWVINLTKEN